MPFRVSVSEDGLETGQSVPDSRGPKVRTLTVEPRLLVLTASATASPISERAGALCRRPRAAPAPPYAELQQLRAGALRRQPRPFSRTGSGNLASKRVRSVCLRLRNAEPRRRHLLMLPPRRPHND